MPHTLLAENESVFLKVTDTLIQRYYLKYTHCTVGRFYTPPIHFLFGSLVKTKNVEGRVAPNRIHETYSRFNGVCSGELEYNHSTIILVNINQVVRKPASAWVSICDAQNSYTKNGVCGHLKSTANISDSLHSNSTMIRELKQDTQRSGHGRH